MWGNTRKLSKMSLTEMTPPDIFRFFDSKTYSLNPVRLAVGSLAAGFKG